MSLVVSLATRGRPERLINTLQMTVPKITLDETLIVVSVDADDEMTIAARSFIEFDSHIVVDIRDREDSIGEKWNRATDYEGSLYLVQADYTPIMTDGFDQRLLEAAALLPDGIGCVYGHMANLSFTGCQAATRGLIDKLGWMYPPYFPYWFVDHWLDDIARLLDRIVWADVHLAAPRDKPPTQEFREPGFWATFFDSLKLVRRQQAADIINSRAFKEPQWRKDVLLRNFPLVEQRSQAINDIVRGWQIQNLSGDGGERYDRMRAQAMKMMAEAWPALQADMELAA